MNTASYIGRLLSAFTITALLMSIPPASSGQVISRPASITLVARLESLSVAAALLDDEASPGRAHEGLPQVSVLLTTTWAVPSNRTTVKVVEDGKTLFSQAAGDSNRPKRRIDQLNIALPCDRSEAANSETQHRRVIIFVQAL